VCYKNSTVTSAIFPFTILLGIGVIVVLLDAFHDLIERDTQQLNIASILHPLGMTETAALSFLNSSTRSSTSFLSFFVFFLCNEKASKTRSRDLLLDGKDEGEDSDGESPLEDNAKDPGHRVTLNTVLEARVRGALPKVPKKKIKKGGDAGEFPGDGRQSLRLRPRQAAPQRHNHQQEDFLSHL
jgi:hypothetical protein